jgi:GTP cyclohydrolase I
MNNHSKKPKQEQVEEAIRTIISWLGDDPNREGLKETPKRVAKAYTEFFIGYSQDPKDVFTKVFDDIAGYNEMILLQDISFISFCEHHLLPFKGKANVAYIPNAKIVGISKIVRVIEILTKRLQIQERLTAQIANTIEECIKPKGVAVSMVAEHECMACRGVNKHGIKVKTYHLLGSFKEDSHLQHNFFTLSDRK